MPISVREYVFYVFFSKFKKRVFLRFLEMTCQKNVEDAATHTNRSAYLTVTVSVYTLLHLEVYQIASLQCAL